MNDVRGNIRSGEVPDLKSIPGGEKKERRDVLRESFRTHYVEGDLGWSSALDIALGALDAFDRHETRDALAIRRDALAREIVPDSGTPVHYSHFDKDIRAFIDRRIALEDEVVALRKVAYMHPTASG